MGVEMKKAPSIHARYPAPAHTNLFAQAANSLSEKPIAVLIQIESVFTVHATFR
jgi:hypothetical protein